MADKKTASRSGVNDYMVELIHFYFAPRLRSVITILYAIVYSYTALYYTENVYLAFKYIFYTIITSTVLLSISHLFWGILFILTLILPFTLSLYAVFLLYQVWKKHDTWSWHIRLATISLFVIGSISAIVVMDDLVRYVASQDELRSFIEDHYLNGRI